MYHPSQGPWMHGVVSALVSPEGSCYFLTLSFSLPGSPERRLGRHWPLSPSTVVFGARNVYFLTFTQEETIVTSQKGNEGTGQGSDSVRSSCVTHTALRRNLDPDCVKTEEGPSNQLSYFLCSLVPPPPHQENTALWLQKNRIWGSLLDCLRTICLDLGSEEAFQGRFCLEVKQRVRAPQ